MRSRQTSGYVPPSYKQYLYTLERGLASLTTAVSALTSESDLTIEHRRTFGYLFSIANANLQWSKDQIIAAFAPLNTTLVCCLDCCPVAYRREGISAEKFGKEEVLTSIDMMTRSEAVEWIIDHGHKVGYTPDQIEAARTERKRLRRGFR